MADRSPAVRVGRELLDHRRAGRTTVWIMAVMLFLTTLAGALGLATAQASRGLSHQLAGRMTVQVVDPDATRRDAAAAQVQALLARDPGVARAVPVDRTRLAELVRPWLGDDAGDPDLPLPAMIDVDLTDGSPATAARVAQAVAAAVPGARVDRAERWMTPVARAMSLVTGFALGIVVLIAAATAMVVLLATRLGLDTHRDTLAVLHNLGSTDVQVARLFQRRVALDTLGGGIAGTLLGLAVLLVAAGQFRQLGSELVSGATLGTTDWLVLALLPFAFTGLATIAARVAVVAQLRRVL